MNTYLVEFSKTFTLTVDAASVIDIEDAIGKLEDDDLDAWGGEYEHWDIQSISTCNEKTDQVIHRGEWINKANK